jgi:hypothetical protein
MNDNLSGFLADLASSPDRMVAFLADPDRVCDDAGLSDDAREAIRNRDARRLAAALNGDLQMQSTNSQNGAIAPEIPKKKAPARKAPAKKKPTGGKKKKGGGRKGGRKKAGTKR